MSNSKSNKKAPKTFTMEEVAKHDDPSRSLWIVVNGDVLDVTKFAAEHPGGRDVLVQHGGTDCSSIFESSHSTKAKELAKLYIIGKLAPKTEEKSNKKKH